MAGSNCAFTDLIAPLPVNRFPNKLAPNVPNSLLFVLFLHLFNKGNPVFSNGHKGLPKTPPDYPIICNRVFDNFKLAEELFAKALKSFEACVLVNNKLCEKLFSSLESAAIFDESFKVTSVSVFTPDFNLLSCELENFTFKVLY